MTKLGEFPVAAVLRAENMERAAKFYTEVLGLERQEDADGSSEQMFAAGDGTMIMIYERPGMPPPQNTAVGFGVPPGRFDEVLDDLRSKGVTFEEYDLPDIGLKTVNGVADYEGMKAAWFKDPEGNILNIATM